MGLIRKEDCDHAIRSGIEFLRAAQLSSGEFATVVAKDENLSVDALPDSSVFATAHIVSSLVGAGCSEALPLVRKAADFLTSQRLPGGFWKFWTRDHPGFAGIPPDADDSSVVCLALQDAGRKVEQNSALLAANHDDQGRFFTWIKLRPSQLLNPRHWSAAALWLPPNRGSARFFALGQARPDDVDAVVNANVAGWLAESPAVVSRAVQWVTEVVARGQEEEADRFYQSRFALYYAIVRGAARGIGAFKDLHGLMTDRLEKAQDSEGRTGHGPHDTALAAIVLCFSDRRGEPYDRAIKFLLQTQRGNGSWPPLAFYFGGRNKVRQWGSAELTTAFCVEALGRYLNSAD